MRSGIVRWRFVLAVTMGLFAVPHANAEVQTKAIEYKDGDTVLAGFLAWDDSLTGARPGVLVVHEWWGLNDYVKSRAKQLASEGYVAFALDLYGDNKVTTHAEEANEWMTQIASNLELWTRRAQPVGLLDGSGDVQRILLAGSCDLDQSRPVTVEPGIQIDVLEFIPDGRDVTQSYLRPVIFREDDNLLEFRAVIHLTLGTYENFSSRGFHRSGRCIERGITNRPRHLIETEIIPAKALFRNFNRYLIRPNARDGNLADIGFGRQIVANLLGQRS